MAAPSIPNRPFPFLQLSPEIRNMIYLLALPSDPVQPRGPKSTKVWRDDSGQWRRSVPWIQPQHPSLNIFLVCRQFHQEASYIFYGLAHFVIKLERKWSGQHVAGTQAQNPTFKSNDQWKTHYERVRHIDLQLSWDFSHPVSRRLHLFRTSRLLENFWNLRTVTVRFTPFSKCSGGEKDLTFSPDSLDENECVKLLRSLEWLPKRYPDLRIEIETFRLEQQEGSYSWFTVYKRLEEYMEEMRGFIRKPAGRERHNVLMNFIG